MESKCFAIFALVVLATVFVSTAESSPVAAEMVESVATADNMMVPQAGQREGRFYGWGYPGYGYGGLYGGLGNTGSSAAAAAAASASSSGSGMGYPYGRK